MMYLRSKALVVLVLLLGLTGCRWFDDGDGRCDFFKERDFENGYEFDIPVSIAPHKQVYNVGDTITVYQDYSDVFECKLNNHRYQFENFPFRPYSDIYLFTGEKKGDDMVCDFGLEQILFEKNMEKVPILLMEKVFCRARQFIKTISTIQNLKLY